MEKETLAREFGFLIRKLRLAKGYSQERFSEVCRIDRSYMGMIERGEVNVTLGMIDKLSKALDLSLSSLFLKLEQHSDDEPQ